MRRFHCLELGVGPVPEGAVPERETRHLRKVLRAVEGTRVLLMDGAGGIGEAVVASGGVLFVKKTERYPRPSVRLHLFVAPPSSKSALDHMLRQCAEVGAWSVDFMLTERSVARLSGENAFERARLHLIEGCKQSGNPWFPRLGGETLPFDDAIAKAAALDMAFFGSTRGGDAESAASSNLPDGSRDLDVAWMVGPEGGFSPDEEERLSAAGVEPLSLGSWTLRVETAAVLGCHVFLSRRPKRVCVNV